MERKGTEMLSLGILLLFVSGISAEIFITHAPSHVQFQQNAGDLKLSELPRVISTAFGFEISKDLSWNGLGSGDLFKRPKANFLISIETPDDNSFMLPHIAQYHTEEDVAEIDTDSVTYDILSMDSQGEKPLVVDMSQADRATEMRSHYPELFRDVPSTVDGLRHLYTEGRGVYDVADLGALNVSHDADVNFLGELQVIHAAVNALQEKGSEVQGRLPNFFHFKIRGLNQLAAAHGFESQAIKDAHVLLSDFVSKVTTALRKLYGDNVLVEVVTVPEHSLSRKARHLLQAAQPTTAPTMPNLGLAAEYDEMFPIAFNIILWLMVTLALSLIAISYGIWYMDPGRDSIIYRMTSQRMKKD